MSLLQIRRERKEQAGGPIRPPALWKLVAGFALVGALLWYLARFV
jgi:hypothetical protein